MVDCQKYRGSIRTSQELGHILTFLLHLSEQLQPLLLDLQLLRCAA